MTNVRIFCISNIPFHRFQASDYISGANYWNSSIHRLSFR